MKRKKIWVPIVLAMSAIGYTGTVLSTSNQSFADLQQDDIEALASCESIGWWDNNGNCVKNSHTGEYFCKDDSWDELTDCLK